MLHINGATALKANQLFNRGNVEWELTIKAGTERKVLADAEVQTPSPKIPIPVPLADVADTTTLIGILLLSKYFHKFWMISYRKIKMGSFYSFWHAKLLLFYFQ